MRRIVDKFAAALASLSAKLNNICATAAIVFLLLMLGAVALQVVARYVFFSPPAWTEELARYAMVWAGFLGATVSFYRNADPVLTTPDYSSPVLQRFFLLLRNATALIFLIPIIYWSPTIISHHLLRETESLKLVSGYVVMIVPLFSSVILVHIFARLVSSLSGAEEPVVEELA